MSSGYDSSDSEVAVNENFSKKLNICDEGHRNGHGGHGHDHQNGHGHDHQNGHGHHSGHGHDGHHSGHGHHNGHGHEHDHDDHSGSNVVHPVERIIKGFNNFLDNQYREYPEKFEQLAQSQSPKFLVFSCSDSRVSPSHIIDFKPGDAFGFRNISALVPPFDTLRYSGVGATIEYAVEHLKVENILVIGHSGCGGITRLMSYPEDGSAPSDFLDDWVSIAQSAKEKIKAEFGHLSPDEQRDLCVQESVNVSLENLRTYPYVQKAIEEGKLALRGAYYDFVVGSLKLWELKSDLITKPIIIA